jgi:hypothetical protein
VSTAKAFEIKTIKKKEKEKQKKEAKRNKWGPETVTKASTRSSMTKPESRNAAPQ